MAHATKWRASLVLMALILVSAIIVFTAERSSAESHILPSADTIVLELESGNNRVVYGDAQQFFSPDPSDCDVTTSGDSIFVFSTTATNKKGDEVAGTLGLVDDGLGSDLRGNGNAQDCGRVGADESLTFLLSSDVGHKAIEAVDWHFEGKFDAQVAVEYLVPGGTNFTEIYDLSDAGSDSGPDAKLGDDYRIDAAPREPANADKLFYGVTIRAVSGEVALKGGLWPDPDIDRTVFHLVTALDCGDATVEGGPDLADDPLSAFYVGPSTKVDPPCGVPVEITTENDTAGSGEQRVNVAPPAGLTWDGLGVTGLVTIEWDIEIPDDHPIDRTFVRVGLVDTEIPWCAQDIGISLVAGSFFYELDPYTIYPFATGALDTCLIDQSTETVEFDDDNDPGTPPVVRTQTTEVFYIYNDPLFVRK
jgi:hypothetical protein